MGLISKIFGGGSETIKSTESLLDTIFTSKDEKLTHAEIFARIQQAPQMGQIEINKIQANHRSIFVAGGRPALIWVCALALLFHFVGIPILNWFLLVISAIADTKEIPQMVPLNIGELIALLSSMMGLVIQRSADKKNGVTHK